MRFFHTPADRYLHLGTFPSPQCVHVGIGGAPEFMHGLRALFVSDVHLRAHVSDDRLAALIALIAAQRADLMLLGGDYAETPADCLRFFCALEPLSFPLGAYAVPGNNDVFPVGDILAEAAAKARVHLLKNRVHTLALSGGNIAIGGCDEHKYGAPRTEHLFSACVDAYRILLSHFPVLPDCPCELMLSGHTHAGQFNLAGLTPYSLGFERRYCLCGVRGLTKNSDMRILIGNGIGVSRIPLRLGAQPQIYLLEFGSKDFLENLAVKS